MAFLELYVDESYGDLSPNIVIAGFVAHIDRWAQFASAWKTEILEKFGIPFLHVTELWNPLASLYKHLSAEHRDAVFEGGIALIESHVDMGVACVINRNDFAELVTQSDRGKFGTDYTFGVRYCLTVVARNLQSAAGKTMSVFLEDGHRNTGQAIEFLLQERSRQQIAFDMIVKYKDRVIVWRDPAHDSLGIELGVVDTGTKRDKLPLQAADILAFSLLHEDKERYWNAISRFGSNFPLLVHQPSRKSLEDNFIALKQEEARVRKLQRRFNSVARQMKSNGQRFNKEGITWEGRIDEAIATENEVIETLGLEDASRLLKSPEQFSAEDGVTITCSTCQIKYEFHGASSQRGFRCPSCLATLTF